MSEDSPHDLHQFMQHLSSEMAAEYDYIQKWATEDPGTAGDRGEENWAELLRGWLPLPNPTISQTAYWETGHD